MALNKSIPSYGVLAGRKRGRPKGLKMSAETRARMSEAHRGVKQSPEHVENRRASLTGQPAQHNRINWHRLVKTSEGGFRRSFACTLTLAEYLRLTPQQCEWLIRWEWR